MRFDIVTIFPELIGPYFQGGLLNQAQERGILEIHLHALRDFADGPHRQVDDRPYGGGPGMVLKPEPFYRAVEAIRAELAVAPRVVLLSARGRPFTQATARELARNPAITLLCGRYQGVDERVLSLCTDELSVGDFVLSGGEIPALLITEAVGRHVPGVLGNLESLEQDSFSEADMLGPPQYTRPPTYRGRAVPEVLLSGDHQRISQWRHEEAERKRRELRPDLAGGAEPAPGL